MVNVKKRYRPKLKKGILQNKKSFFFGKDLTTLRKKKWSLFLKLYYKKSFFLESVIRNDVQICFEKKNRLLDLRKEYSRSFFSLRKLVTFFRKFKTTFFRQLFLKIRNKKISIKTLFIFTEFRLDIILKNSNFVRSLYYARWLTLFGFVFLNKKKFCVVSILLTCGDFLTLRNNFFLKNYFFNLRSFSLPSEFLEINYKTLSIIVLKIPASFLQKREIYKQYFFFFFLEELTNLFIKN